MEICSDRRHDEVAYAVKYCPVCTALDDMDEVQKELNNMRVERDYAIAQRDDARQERDDLFNQAAETTR